jgi:putative tryptophan/tyrosine transport system substrate-binding protein
MKRRTFIAGLGSAAVWPVAVRAQQRAMPVIGYLDAGSLETRRGNVAAVHRGLSETGYVEGRNLAVEYRWADDRLDRLPALADDLVRRQVAVIVAMSIPGALAAKTATKSIPIVFAFGADPVEGGLVTSLNRPGGNLTGAARLSSELGPKRLQLLQELVPAASTIALLVNPGNPSTEASTKEMQAAGRTLGLSLLALQAGTDRDLEAAFTDMARLHAQGMVISPDPFFIQQSARLAALALEHAIPAMFQYREFAAAGGLISYAGSRTESYRLVGLYAGRILKGEKPADLPVQQPTMVELIINLKTARTLGISVPLTLLARADEVIE